MTYLVLARKWRPRSFDTLIGQDHVVRALSHALSTQRLHHAWLFTGTRGVGKTTLSRILAKSLNCEKGITSTPCGVCRACTEIDTGRFVDYLELDAASNRGVDEMTQLLEQAVYAPSVGRFKVYMIDEVHMLTGHAFNAMLKTLEEPPPHVKFILATTDPQKIPVTVLSRCLQFNLKQMTAEAIVGHLQSVLEQEQIGFQTPALRLIAQAASGSMRDALSLTDQAIAYSAGDLSTEALQGMLGTIDQRYLSRLLLALSEGSAVEVLRVADELATRGLSYSGALADLAVLLSRVAIEQRIAGSVSDEDPAADDIVKLAGLLHPDLVQLYYTVAVHSRNELALAPDEYAGFVMACLRMLALAPQQPPPAGTKADVKALDNASDQAGSTGGDQRVQADAVRADDAVGSAAEPASSLALQKPKPESAIASEPTVARAHPGGVPPMAQSGVAPPNAQSGRAEPFKAIAVPPPSPRDGASERPPAVEHSPDDGTVANQTNPEPTAAPVDDVPAWEDIPDGDDTANLIPYDDCRDATGSEGAPVLEDVEELSMALPDEVVIPAFASDRKKIKSPRLRDMTATAWPALAAQLPATGLAAELARQSEWVGVRDGRIMLRVAVRTLAESAGKARLCTLMSEHFGAVVTLDVDYGITGDDTAHAMHLADQAQRQLQAEQAVQEDAFVRTLVKEFDARVIPGSVRAVPQARAA